MKKILFKHLALFFTALSFLSRLPSGKVLSFLLAHCKEELLDSSQASPFATPLSRPCGTVVKNNLTDQAKAQADQVEAQADQAKAQADQVEAQAKQAEAQAQQTQINLGKSVGYFPLIGIFLGSLAVLPLWLGLGGSNFWLQSWLYVLFMAWLSRGLHWDGLADLADACASFSQGEKFWKIIKDSNLGALGALVLFFVLAGYIIVVQALIANGQWLSLIWAAAAGRLACLALAGLTLPYNRASLAKIFEYAKPLPWAIFWGLALFAFGGFFISWQACCLAFVLGGGVVFYLLRLAKKQGGYNGDFLGAAIVLGELIVLLAFLLTS